MDKVTGVLRLRRMARKSSGFIRFFERLDEPISSLRVACLLALFPFAAAAQTYAWQEGYKQVVPSSNIEGLSTEGLFGEQIGLYTGSLSFSATYVDIPGNNALKVAFTRSFALDEPKVMRGWVTDLPHLDGVYPKDVGWTRKAFTGEPLGRCSGGKAAPPMAEGGISGGFGGISTWDPTQYWNGDFLSFPGQGKEEILKAQSSGAKLPQDSLTYVWLTKSGWRFTCASTAASDGGETFIGVSPDGIRYRFDRIEIEDEETIQRPQAQGPDPIAPPGNRPRVGNNKIDYLHRERVRIYPTRAEDRFGNFVTYGYGPNGLTSITSSDGRSIAINYTGNGLSSVVANGRTWTFGSDSEGKYRVTLPDGKSYWQYDFAHLSSRIRHISGDTGTLSSPGEQCDRPPHPLLMDPGPSTGTVRHPSGAVGTFTVVAKQHGRSYVDRNCIGGQIEAGAWYGYAYRPYVFDVVSLSSRQISGPGLTTLTWQYEYGPANNSWSEDCVSGCAATKYVDVTEPDGVRVRHTFSNRYRYLEGRELSTEVFDASGVSQRKTTYAYQTDPNGQPYPAEIGAEGYLRGDQSALKFDPPLSTVVRQGGVDFKYEVQTYDDLARPTRVKRSSAPAP